MSLKSHTEHFRLSGVNYFFRRVASFKDVTEMLVVVGERRQDVTDVLR